MGRLGNRDKGVMQENLMKIWAITKFDKFYGHLLELQYFHVESIRRLIETREGLMRV